MNIYCFGSSVIEGVGAEDGKGWANHLKSHLFDHNIQNYGISGTTTSFWKDKIKVLIEFWKKKGNFPDIVIISLSLGNEYFSLQLS